MKYHAYLLIFLFGICLGIPSYAQNAEEDKTEYETEPITSFEALMESLTHGEMVRAIIHYGKCTLIIDGEPQESSPDAIGGMTLEVFEYFAKGAVYNPQAFVVSSEAKLIKNPIGPGFVYNYAKVRVYADGKATIQVNYLKPDSFEVTMSEEFQTQLFDGDNEGGLHLFRED
ncbi:MAG: hypothetical protein AAGI38_05130 [Bacteroidota bacterium]